MATRSSNQHVVWVWLTVWNVWSTKCGFSQLPIQLNSHASDLRYHSQNTFQAQAISCKFRCAVALRALYRQKAQRWLCCHLLIMARCARWSVHPCNSSFPQIPIFCEEAIVCYVSRTQPAKQCANLVTLLWGDFCQQIALWQASQVAKLPSATVQHVCVQKSLSFCSIEMLLSRGALLCINILLLCALETQQLRIWLA